MTSYLKVGDTVAGRYRIIRPLSAGGMGAVFLAEQTSLGREVAIKVILDGVKDKETLDRFDLEARAVCLLKHPNIITYHDYGRDDNGNPYIVMEFLPGFPASKLFEPSTGATLEVLIHVASQMCSALAEAHRAGIVHRDLKWTNIMICPQGHDQHFAKLIDFGIVKMPADHAMKKGVTQTGMLLGTPQYMPPEAIQGKTVDGRADQYSLAVMLWEGVEGRKPFDSDSMFEVFRMHVQDPTPVFVKGQALLNNYPGLEDAIVRAMSKDPADRFPTILHFQQALHEALGLSGGPSSSELARTSLPGGTGLTPASRRGRGGTGLQPMDTRLRTEANGKKGGIPKWAMAAIGVGVALAGVAGVLVATGGKAPDDPSLALGLAGAEGVTDPAVEHLDPTPPAETRIVAAVDSAPDVIAEAGNAADIVAAEPDTAVAMKDEPEVSVAAVEAPAAATTVGAAAVVAAATTETAAATKAPISDPKKVLTNDPKRTQPPVQPIAKTRQLVVAARPWGNITVNGREVGQNFNEELATNQSYKIVATHPSLGRAEKLVRLLPDPEGKPLRVILTFDQQ